MGWTDQDVAEWAQRMGRLVDTSKSLGAALKVPKYRSRKTEVDGIVFDSTAEAEAYIQLKAAEKAGAITNLELQPIFMLQPGFRAESGKWQQRITYRADFSFDRGTDRKVVVDVKSRATMTPTARMKHKLFRALYPELTLELWSRVSGKQGRGWELL